MAIGRWIGLDFQQRMSDGLRYAWAVAACCVLAFGAGAAYPQCPEQRFQFRITDEQIAKMEQSEAEGHQPWRSNAKFVSDSGLMQVDRGLDPKKVDSIPFNRKRLSPMREVYSYSPNTPGRRARVTVRRFRWRDPTTGKTHTTVWWVTEVVIEDCGDHGKKEWPVYLRVSGRAHLAAFLASVLTS
jgi:hypothetical protein